MDATEKALLRAVCAEPGDDTPRLVFADWLDEHDQPERAEFIRVQCELAKLVAAGEGKAARRFIARAIRLLENPAVRPGTTMIENGDVLLDLGDEGGVHCTFWRGFPWKLELRAADWLAHADRLAWHPTQTVACKERKPLETYYQRPDHDTNCYGGCHGTGTVPRPFVETAQPITHVTLTTWVDRGAAFNYALDDDLDGLSGHAARVKIIDNVRKRWHWITFDVTAPPLYATVSATGDPGPDVPYTPPAVYHSADFTPVFTTPPEPAIPADGWRIEVRDEIDWDTTERVPGFGPLPGHRRRGLLTWEGDSATRLGHLPGRTFGPIDATDQYGQVWRCPSCVVSAAEVTAPSWSGPRTLRIHAETMGVFNHTADPSPVA